MCLSLIDFCTLPIFFATSLTASAVSVKYEVFRERGIVFTFECFLCEVLRAKAVKASVNAEQGILFDVDSIISCRLLSFLFLVHKKKVAPFYAGKIERKKEANKKGLYRKSGIKTALFCCKSQLV
jgi:hypothetical protein